MSDEALTEYSVHAVWQSPAEVTDLSLATLGQGLQPDDETFCFWVDPKDPRRVTASWDLRAESFEDAARLCKAEVDALAQLQGFGLDLIEIGASTEDGYWVSSDPTAISGDDS